MNLNWFKKPAAPKSEVAVVRRESMKLRLSEWRASPKLVNEAHAVLAIPAAQWMLDVLRNENPGNSVLSLDSSPQARIAQQCRAEGYLQCLTNFEALGTTSQPPETIEPTFEPDEKDTQTE